MYLSRLILNPSSRNVRRDLSNCQDLHRTLLKAFPSSLAGPSPVRAEHGILHRLEIAGGAPIVLVQSQEHPDWSCLDQGYLLPVAGQENPACKPLDETYSTIRDGLSLRFRLTANPTRKVETKTRPDGTKSNGRREPLRTEQEQLDWLRRKADASGFEILSVKSHSAVPDVQADEQRAWTVRKGRKGDGRSMTFHAVQFEGRLKVKDRMQFIEALKQGIGGAKAYGFGLLSIAPAG